MNSNIARSGHAKNWINAYGAFLRSPQENLILKVAPVLLVLGSPEILVSNLLPVVGEVLDIGTFGMTALVIFQTVRAVKKYR